MKEVKFYCDFCGTDIIEKYADGNFRGLGVYTRNHIEIKVDTNVNGLQKHNCVECLIKLLQIKETDAMMRKVRNQAPLQAKKEVIYRKKDDMFPELNDTDEEEDDC